MDLYEIAWRPVWRTIFKALLCGKFGRLKRALDYLNARLEKKLARLRTRNEELDRRLAMLNARLTAPTPGLKEDK